MEKLAFDNEKYLREQTAAIIERVGRFSNKLYLEFGGKLLYDHHAERVLPGCTQFLQLGEPHGMLVVGNVRWVFAHERVVLAMPSGAAQMETVPAGRNAFLFGPEMVDETGDDFWLNAGPGFCSGRVG